MGGKTSTASRSKYNAKTYERLVLNLRIDSPQSKKAIEAAAEQAGESATAYVVEAVRRRMEQEQMLSASDTPGVVKNLEGDTDPVEWDRYSISPDRIESSSRRPLSFTEMWSAGAFLAQKITWPMQKSTNQADNGYEILKSL